MGELLLLMAFLAGLFAIQPMSQGLSVKVTAIMAGGYMVVFAVVAGLLARLL